MKKPEGLYPYIAFTATIHVKYAMATVISKLEEKATIVDFDEHQRRLLVKATPRAFEYVKELLEKYSIDYTVEFKAVIHKVARPHLRDKLHAVKTPSGQYLFLYECKRRNAVLWGEWRRQRLLVKYCRRGSSLDPIAMPPSMCVFTRREDLRRLLEDSLDCIKELVEFIGK